MKNAFISSKKLIVLEMIEDKSKINLKVHDANNCLNKNSITHFV